MRAAAVSPTSERLLELAYQYLSSALQCDYLSNGSGSGQSTPLRSLRPALPARPRAGTRSRDVVRQYLDEIATRKRLTSSEEYRLAVLVRNGDAAARRRLIEHQLGLVVLIARSFRNSRLPLLDLIAEGNIGLIRATEKFDPERGCRFSTYAKWWIRQSMDLALMTQAATVRLPVYVSRALKKQAKAQASLTRAGAAAGNESPQSSPTGAQFLLHDVRDQSHVERVAAPEDEQPDWRLQVTGRLKYLEAAMSHLKESEVLVLRARFGLAGESDCTLQSIAGRLNLSSERVRQIQAEALGKLRHILEADYGLSVEGLL
jgi:RNA polymerase nonessential primary-like sigma factor